MDYNGEKLSPFSVHRVYAIQWGIEKEQRKFPLDKNHEKMIQDLGILKCATKLQLAHILNPGNIRRGKQTVLKLVDHHILILHQLYEEKTGKVLPFYTLSSKIAEKQGFGRIKHMRTSDILRGLLMSQFYIRFMEIDPSTTLLPFPSPFESALKIMGMDFRVGICRGSAEPLTKHFLYHQENMKTFIIIEDIRDAEVLKEIKSPIRITTDYDILRGNLSTSFYLLNKNIWQKEYVPNFEKLEEKRCLVKGQNSLFRQSRK